MELCVDFLRFIIQKMQHVVASKGEVQVYLQPAVKGNGQAGVTTHREIMHFLAIRLTCVNLFFPVPLFLTFLALNTLYREYIYQFISLIQCAQF